MKIQIDGVDIFELSDVQKKVIQNDIPSEIFEEDMKRRLKWVLLDEKYAKCIDRLKKEWVPILAKRMDSIPTDDEKLANLIFSQPDYKCRSDRDKQPENR